MSREPSFTDERRSSSAAVQALAASLRSFFGPDKAAKCIVEEGASAAPTIAGCTLDFLQSVRIRHPAFSYAMEVVDGQVGREAAEDGGKEDGRCLWRSIPTPACGATCP